ncbi:MAG: domain pair [Chloroflexota bacterium]|nr:domain pair [Chloroflexota bacterium]
MTVWFTVKLDDRPGSLARVAAALGDRGVNITGIVGVAEDTDGALMLTTSDAAATREAFASLGLAFEEHDPAGGLEPDELSVSDLRPGAAGRGSLG